MIEEIKTSKDSLLVYLQQDYLQNILMNEYKTTLKLL